MKDWYLDALDEKFWSECVARILNSEIPFPTRPARTFNIEPRRSDRRNTFLLPRRKTRAEKERLMTEKHMHRMMML